MNEIDGDLLELLNQLPCMFDTTNLSDEDLLGKLAKFNINLERDAFGELCERSTSASQAARTLIDQNCPESVYDDDEVDWIYVSVTALWERWFPEYPCFDHIEELMVNGYSEIDREEFVSACKLWAEAWKKAKRLVDKLNLESAAQLDERINGVVCVTDWMNDFASLMLKLERVDERYMLARIAFGKEARRLLAGRRKAIAGEYLLEDYEHDPNKHKLTH